MKKMERVLIRRGIAGLIMMMMAVSPVFGLEAMRVPGITEAVHDVTLSAEATGQISVLYVREGSRVKKGDRLLGLESRIETLEVQRQKLIWESRVELDSAIERIVILKSLLDSNRSLYEKTRSVSEEELQKMELDYKMAVAEKKRLQVAEKREKIEYEIARETLEKRMVTSPVDGVVVTLFLDKGEHCQSREPLIRVADTRRCLFVSNVTAEVGHQLKNRQTVVLHIGTGDFSIEKKGEIVFISPVVDSASGLMEVKVEFDNTDEAVKPGISGRLSLTLR